VLPKGSLKQAIPAVASGSAASTDNPLGRGATSRQLHHGIGLRSRKKPLPDSPGSRR
jgi:hypothetical protein